MAQSPFPLQTFQYANATPVANGYLLISLNKDVVAPNGQIGAGVQVKVSLDANGTIMNSPLFWPNSQLNPSDADYILSVYTGVGHRVLGPVVVAVGTAPDTGFGESFGTSFGS